MTAASFDTLRASKRLKDLGFREDQAEGVAEMMRESLESGISQLATKADLDQLRTELRTGLQLLEQRMTIKLGGMLAAAVILVTAAVKLL